MTHSSRRRVTRLDHAHGTPDCVPGLCLQVGRRSVWVPLTEAHAYADKIVDAAEKYEHELNENKEN